MGTGSLLKVSATIPFDNHEDIYLRAYETPAALRVGLARYFEFYNTRRRHAALDRRTPDAVYFEQVAAAA